MFKKICSSPENNIVGTCDHDEIVANPKIVRRFSKLARSIKSIAPKSDDFLYFSIIFLKAAESSLLDDNGSIKKVAGEDAWGFFDENWKWHGNVQPHRNNNKDIFPESELKKATASWVGLPLCRDHESSSVDGIRGIILDTHYDEKFKQVIGLCVLDKVNYPDLARKAETGLVRYGSMGTAVETSICSDCGNRATNQDEYCNHIMSKNAHGEINVGLKPIEYSLVVQPAEPGAILLKCIASLNEYKEEFTNYGVDNVSAMLGQLSLGQAKHLEGIMKTACGTSGCSIEDRTNIVKSFLSNNGLLKTSENNYTDSSEKVRNNAEALKATTGAAGLLSDPAVEDDVKDVIRQLVSQLKTTTRDDLSETPSERFTSYENSNETSTPGGGAEYSSATSRINLGGGGDTGNNPDFSPDDDILSFNNPSGGEAVTVATGKQDQNVKTANDGGDSMDFVDDFSINSIMEDIMNESRLRKRAELRRRIAYMQGGSEGAEPNTYKGETYDWNKDKQMHQDGNMGGADGMVPGDKESKEKLSRAKLEERRLRRLAYMQGGSEGAEPNTYKGETYDWNKDKQMHQDGNMGGADGMVPGDKESKEKLSRASQAYNGPGLSTRFTIRRNGDGSANKAASVLEVFAGNKRVIAATGQEIFGPELNENWEWLKSREYGKELCGQIRTAGLDPVARLLKAAQELPPLPEEGAGDLPPLPEEGAGDLPPLPEEGAGDLPPLDDVALGGEGEEEEQEPAKEIDDRLAEMEQLLDEVRDYVSQLEDSTMADVDVNVFTGKGEGEEGEEVEAGLGALSSNIVRNLKTAYRKLDNSADELSMVAETYDNISKLSSSQKNEFVKLASDAMRDADQITGETKALVSIATSLEVPTAQVNNAVDSVEDSVNYAEDSASDAAEDYAGDAAEDYAGDAVEDDAAIDDLVASAMSLRRSRREAILKQADDRVLAARAASREAILKSSMEMEVEEDEVAEDALDDNLVSNVSDEVSDAADGMIQAEAAQQNSSMSAVKEALANKVESKRQDEAREAYRVKLRRAYDVGMDMQRKGLLPTSKASLDRQVDDIMTFDDNAFEAFKRSIANARPVGTVKGAADLGGVNIGVEADSGVGANSRLMSADTLSSLWE